MLIYVCDDNEEHQKMIRDIINSYFESKNATVNVKLFSKAQKLMFALDEEVKHIDAFFLDIEIDEANGIELAETINNRAMHSDIVYMSAHSKYVFDVFKTSPTDYILKPFNAKRVYETLDRIYEKANQNRNLEVMISRKIVEINIDSIIYIESSGRVLKIHTECGDYKTYEKMDNIVKKINYVSLSFVRIHKSSFINYDFVEKQKGDQVFLFNGKALNISRQYKEKLSEFSVSYIRRKLEKMEMN